MIKTNRNNLSRSERKAMHREETERETNKMAEQRRLLDVARRVAEKKRIRKILLYTYSILLVAIVSVGYYVKARETAIIEYVETDPAITTAYVDKVHTFGIYTSHHILYHYYVDGNRFDMDD